VEAFINVLARSPLVTEIEATPSNLANPLLPHKRWCLRSLLWRESEDPAGEFVLFLVYQKVSFKSVFVCRRIICLPMFKQRGMHRIPHTTSQAFMYSNLSMGRIFYFGDLNCLLWKIR
jgi:hypothetical protein